MQYAVPFTCTECSEHTFEMEGQLLSEGDLANSNCTNCGRVLEAEEIAEQAKAIPGSAIEKMIEDAKALNRKYAGH